MQDIKTRYEHAARFLPGQVERLVLNGEPVIRRSPAGVLYFAREYRLPDGAVAREFVSLARCPGKHPLRMRSQRSSSGDMTSGSAAVPPVKKCA